MEEVLESTHWVVEHSELVRLDREALARFALELAAGELKVPRWNYRYHFHDGGERTVAYLLVLDSLNFCFWAPEGKPKWEIDYQGEPLSGYFALAAALKRAFEAGMPFDEARFLAQLSLDELEAILAGRGELQLLDRRLAILNELGKGLLERYGGGRGGRASRSRPSRLVEAAAGKAVELVRSLARDFPSFRDEALYKGQRILFYKRAQIFAADLWLAFGGQDWGSFTDVDRLTAFADYKLPQVLRQLGILRYSLELAAKVDRLEPLPPGSPEEIEIRANTIWAVELLRQELARLGQALMSVELDWLLWEMGQREEFKQKPHHRTVTIFY
ncbi:MAG: queuosine 5'-phosphate N-glycosylase/hydrolase [Candidatus Bipolaricaulia bacterium]